MTYFLKFQKFNTLDVLIIFAPNKNYSYLSNSKKYTNKTLLICILEDVFYNWLNRRYVYVILNIYHSFDWKYGMAVVANNGSMCRGAKNGFSCYGKKISYVKGFGLRWKRG